MNPSLISCMTYDHHHTHTDPGPHARRVVLVDDSDDLRALVRLTLTGETDFVVVDEAADGHEGVAVAQVHQPHLVLLDISMPVMDGLQALTLIREQCPDTTVVMLSAFGPDSGVAQKALAMGAHGYVDKGTALVHLAERLRALLGTAPADTAIDAVS